MHAAGHPLRVAVAWPAGCSRRRAVSFVLVPCVRPLRGDVVASLSPGLRHL